MNQLHNVKWQIESLAPSGYYAYGFGGGLAEAITTDSCDTKLEAYNQLKNLLSKLGRQPEPIANLGKYLLAN